MCCGGRWGDGADRSGSEFNVDWKGVDCRVSVGSEARFDSVKASERAALVSIGVSASIWTPLAAPGAALSWDRGCEVGSALILWCSVAGAATGGVVWGQAGWSIVSMWVSVGGAEPEGRRRRLAAWASSAEEIASWGTGMAWKQTGTQDYQLY